jgi:xylulose-5-phosphate/fructose-6-phosphate phosphoketolase
MATKTAEPPVIHATENDSISAYGPARSTIQERPLTAEALRKIHAYWRACNYMSLA